MRHNPRRRLDRRFRLSLRRLQLRRQRAIRSDEGKFARQRVVRPAPASPAAMLALSVASPAIAASHVFCRNLAKAGCVAGLSDVLLFSIEAFTTQRPQII